MDIVSATPHCPHCDHAMRKIELPDEGGWDAPFHWVCFNDECPYFRRGWTRMFDTYGVKASYRFRLDPLTGEASPIPVWSKTALLDRVIEDDADADTTAGTDVIPGDSSGTGGKR
jgi:hypothetical protein